MPSEETIQLIKMKNVIGVKTDLPKQNPRASITSKIRTLLLKLTDTPQLIHKYGTFEQDKTLTFDTGENDASSVISDGNYLYVATDTSPGKIIKVDLSTFTKVATLTLDTNEDYPWSLVLDGTYLYVGIYGTAPGKIIKIDLETFTRVGSLTLDTNENYITSMVSDGTYLYTGHSTFGVVVKVDLATFSRVSSLTIYPGEFNYIFSLETDGTYLYASLFIAPGKIVKIDLSTFSIVETLTLDITEGEADTYSLISDGTHLYAGLNTSPGKVVKIDLATFTKVGTLTFNTGENSAYSLITDGTYLYVGIGTTPGKVVKIDLATFSKVGTLIFDVGDNTVYSMTLDGTYMYASIYTSPGKVVRRYLYPSISSKEKKIDLIDDQLHTGIYNVYPSLASPITLTSGAGVWTYGSYIEIIPADTVLTTFYVTNMSLSDLTANREYQINIATGASASEIGIAAVVHKTDNTNLTYEYILPVPIKVSSRTRISARCADETGSGTCKLKLGYKT